MLSMLLLLILTTFIVIQNITITHDNLVHISLKSQYTHKLYWHYLHLKLYIVQIKKAIQLFLN